MLFSRISAEDDLRRVSARTKALAADYKQYSAAKRALEDQGGGADAVLKKLKEKVKGDVE